MTYTLDTSGECIATSSGNAAQIARDLTDRGHVVTTWSDEGGSKFDLVWSWDATRIGRSSMIDQGPGKLFIGVVGKACFGFGLGSGALAPGYVQEKLKVSGTEEVKRLATLISLVRANLQIVAGHDETCLLMDDHSGGCIKPG